MNDALILSYEGGIESSAIPMNYVRAYIANDGRILRLNGRYVEDNFSVTKQSTGVWIIHHDLSTNYGVIYYAVNATPVNVSSCVSIVPTCGPNELIIRGFDHNGNPANCELTIELNKF